MRAIRNTLYPICSGKGFRQSESQYVLACLPQWLELGWQYPSASLSALLKGLLGVRNTTMCSGALFPLAYFTYFDGMHLV